jgi:YD repeat-containing protein
LEWRVLSLGRARYNADHRRIAVGGSFARTSLPAAFSGTYNPANQLTSYTSGSTTVPSLSYDANGNLQSDGTNTYTWDARNHLSAISGGATASFSYDPFGRRVKATITGQTTQYLYDRRNVVNEQTPPAARRRTS